MLFDTCAAQPGAPSNGFLVNYYLTQPVDSDTQSLQTFAPGPTTLFTPTLFYTVPCTTTEGPVAPGSCTLSRTGVCGGASHTTWKNGTFCG